MAIVTTAATALVGLNDVPIGSSAPALPEAFNTQPSGTPLGQLLSGGTLASLELTSSRKYVLSPRGMFQRVRIYEPEDVDIDLPNRKDRFYAIPDLDAFFKNVFEPLLYYRLYLIQGMSRERNALVSRHALLNNEKRVYQFGQDFTQVTIEGEVFLGPIPVMTNGFIRMLEIFFDRYSLVARSEPIIVQEDYTDLNFYLTSMMIQKPDPQTHVVQFALVGFIAEDTHSFNVNPDRLFNPVFIPDCSKTREEFQTLYVGARRPNTEVILRRNLQQAGLVDDPSADIATVKAAYLDQVGNLGTTAALAYRILGDEVVGSGVTFDDPPLGIAGALRAFLSGQPEPGTFLAEPTSNPFIDTEEAPSGIIGGLVNFTRQKLLGPLVTIGGNFVQDAAERAIERNTNSLIRNLNLDSLVGGDSTLARQVNAHIGNTIGGGIKQFGGALVRNVLWGDRFLYGDSLSEMLFGSNGNFFSGAGNTDAANDTRWIEDYYKGSMNFAACNGYGPTSAKHIEIPPFLLRTEISPAQALELWNSGTAAFTSDTSFNQQLAAGLGNIQASAERSVARSSEITQSLVATTNQFQKSLSTLIGLVTSPISAVLDGVTSIGQTVVTGLAGALDRLTGVGDTVLTNVDNTLAGTGLQEGSSIVSNVAPSDLGGSVIFVGDPSKNYFSGNVEAALNGVDINETAETVVAASTPEWPTT